MKNSVAVLLEEAQRKLSGYAALLNYRLMNLCVKAAPESLLPITVHTGGEGKHLEKVAWARIGDRDDQFYIFPMERSFLTPIVQGIKEVHPEFKIELKKVDEEADDEDQELYIVATMPVVDDARHEVLMDGVALLCDGCDAQMKVAFAQFSGRLAAKMVDATPEEMDEAKDALQEVKDQHEDLCKQFRANKEEEIESAYKQYKEEQTQKQAKLQEELDAHNPQAAKQMKWNPDDE